MLAVLGSAPLKAPAAGERYAVVIGVADYPGTKSDLPVGPAQDADAIYDLLRNHFGVPVENILRINDAEATRTNVIAAFRKHLARAGANDTAILYYSGHGTQAPDDTGLTGATDLEPDGKDEALYLYDGLLLDDEIGALTDGLNAGNVLLVFDSCFSGRGSRDPEAMPKRVPYEELEFEGDGTAMPFDWLEGGTGSLPASATASDMLRDPEGHVLLAASAEDELSWTMRALGMSVFTYFLVDALATADDAVTLSDLMVEVSADTRNRTSGRTQTPQFEGRRRDVTVAEMFR